MMYRKKPVAVEAHQWIKNGDHPDDYKEGRPEYISNPHMVLNVSPAAQRARGWEGRVVRRFRRPDVKDVDICKHCGHRMYSHGWIDTLEGGHIVCPGDWIITGVKGERYPCKPDVFAQTYEPVREDAQ